jgi:hypothetical protein
MGFSDSCLGGVESNRLNETQVYKLADAFVVSGLFAKGYNQINIDDSWELFNRSASGELLPDPTKFPEGMGPVADRLHSQKMKLGLYTSDAQRSCKKTAGSLYHEVQDARTLAQMKIDFIKVDNCGEVNLNSYAKYSAMRDAFNASRQAATDPAITYSCEPHVTSMIGWLPTVCNMWRTTSDNCKTAFSFDLVVSVINGNNLMAWNARPGAWNDLDPVMVGTSKSDGTQGLSLAEARSLFTLYSIVKAPLLLGANPSLMPPEYLAIVGNEELIAVNQDPLGKAAVCVGNNTAASAVAAAATVAAAAARAPAYSQPYCAPVPPPEHLCCMHPHCKHRNQSECLTLKCCYQESTANVNASSACWKPQAPSPTPPLSPTPPPSPPVPTPPSPFGLITACDWEGQSQQQQQQQNLDGKQESTPLLPAQVWELRTGGYITNVKSGMCLTVASTSKPSSIGTGNATAPFAFSLQPCSSTTKGQRFGNTEFANKTVAQIYMPEDAMVAASSISSTTISNLCLSTDGKGLMAMECKQEPDECKHKRCAFSVLYQQLWYRSSTTGQLISTFTDSQDIPPLRDGEGSASVMDEGRYSGWGPDDKPLKNIPVCLSSAANPHPPVKIPLLSPAGVLSGNPKQTVWAGPLSNSSWVLVLWNTGLDASNITASWEQLGIPAAQECAVRDLHAHKDRSRASKGVTFEVPSHDVVAVKLSDCTARRG